MTLIEIHPYQITELHEVRDNDKLTELVADMTQNGWQGRPILAADCGDYYQALTGSHRIASARQAELDSIPVAIVNINDLCNDYDMTIDDITSNLDYASTLLREYDADASKLLDQDL